MVPCPALARIWEVGTEQRHFLLDEFFAHNCTIDGASTPRALTYEHLTTLEVCSNDIDLHLAPPVAADRLGSEWEAASPPLLYYPLPGEIFKCHLVNKGAETLLDRR